MTIALGTKLGRYEIRSKIGEGGMGEVYLAQDPKLDRKVALKILPADLAANRDRMRRFVREAKAAAALNHPNIATIHEIGESNNVNFIAMEFIDGCTLRDLIHSGPTDLAKLLRYLQHVAEGLAKAHTAGIVHRDLKPDNIMVTRDGHAKILDFGLAKLIEPQQMSGSGSSEVATAIMQQHSTPGTVIGTVGYMSPEQAQGRVQDVDHRSDIFSFGCILFETVTGHRAFEGKDAIDTLNKIIREPVTPISDFRTDLPNHLQRIVRRCLAKDREDRYQTIKDVAIELRELRRGLEGVGADTAVPPAKTEPTTEPRAEIATVESGGAQTRSTPRPITAPASSAEYIITGIKQHKLAAAAILLVLVIGAIGFGLYLHARSTEIAIGSIAVLPFVNQNHDPDAEYLSDGVTESIINSLTQLPNLKVSARSSVFRYKGKEADPMAAGKELGVSAVLTGRIMQRSDSLTISTELLDVRENKQLWGEQYQRKVSDLLAVERDIAQEITGNLRLKLSGPEQSRVVKHYTENPEAYQLYLKGRFHWNRRTEEGSRKAIEYFQLAIEKDPTYALAYTGLADCYSVLGTSYNVASLSPSEAIPKAKAAATKALELDDTLAEAHTSLGYIRLNYDWDWLGAEREFKRAIELDPNYANAHHWYSHYLTAMSRPEESLAESKRALGLDQLDLVMNVHLGWHYFNARQYDLAIEQFRKTLEIDPNYGLTHWYLGQAYALKGMYAEAQTELRKAKNLLQQNVAVEADLGYAYAASGKGAEAKKAIDELKQSSKQRYVSSYYIALIHTGLGEKDLAFEWLENAYKERSDLLIYLKIDPRLDSLRSDARFADLVRRVGLP
jgi:eukaryotic-like serine/threonine-protein kinase